MRIAMVCGSFLPKIGGLEWKVHHLATEFTHRGHDVTVFTVRPRRTFAEIEIPVMPVYRIVRCGFPMPGIERSGVMRRIVARIIIREHRRQRFDVLHCHHLAGPTQWGLDVKARVGVPVVATTTGGDLQVNPEMCYGERRRPHIDRMVRDNLKKADVVGAVSHAMRDELERLGTVARIVEIPNGVAWDEFQIGPARALRRRLKLADEDLLILSVGRNIALKGYDLGLRAFAAVAERFANSLYAIVGQNTEGLGPLVASLGLNSRVRLVGQMPMSELPDVFHSADVFFNPSRMEGFAQVNAQALACGLPCLVTDAPGNRDAADHGGALVARSGDTESMADVLAQLLADPAKRRRLGQEAHVAGKRYAWSRIAEEYLAIFEKLAARRTELGGSPVGR